MLFSGKLNKIRAFAMFFIFAGMGVMYLVFLFKNLIILFFSTGLILILTSVGIYFWAGIVSTHSISIQCPSCKKQTKILGKRDECMHCKAILSLEPKDVPVEIQSN
ncbi:hypothetical protein H2C83_02015 [Thermoactinomyces sp. AMNI-1]|uniref:Zinc-ribbon containing domain-containing protein n=2 Tax=Thermoactinomyces mirandus TaxID=2756294 RepID=A0A7W1XPX5_9BACL|nr:hypothetical protein [Thermoactinomyces mirandus]